MINLIELEDGRKFPAYEGTPLSWSLDYNSFDEESKGFPRMRAVIRAMMEYRPEQLQQERREMIKASFHRMFGHKAKKVLDVIEDELRKAGSVL